jgi:sugar transferase (PEP-CTERM/EpsH1 system associated)
MKILYLAHTCPYPPNRGDRIRCYHLLNHLSKSYEMTLVYPVFDNEHYACQEQLRQYCDSVFPVPYKTVTSYLSCLKSLFSKHPLSVAYFYSEKLAKIVQRLSPDIVLADCSTMAQYALPLPTPKILDYVDIDSKKWACLSSLAHFPYSMIYRVESRRLSRFEQFLSQQFDHCLVTSEHEKSLLDNSPRITVLPNGVDQQYFSTDHIPTDDSIIFTGVMNYFPNTDAVLHFHRSIFPLIRCEVPSARFVIAGMHPTAQIRKLADRHTTVTGFVPDIRVYLSRAAVCVVPLRVAMGVQNKILEAMAIGVPVVATSMANRGINATHGQEILLADDPKQFAAATIRLFHDAHLREMVRENAKHFIEQNFRWEKNLQKLNELIAKLTKSSAMN